MLEEESHSSRRLTLQLSDDLGQLGLPKTSEKVDDFIPHPFFTRTEKQGIASRYEVHSIICKRSSTFVVCSSKEP
jgi:hypothetical protein